MGYYSEVEAVEHRLHNAKARFNQRPTIPLAARIDELKKQRRFWKRVARTAGVPACGGPEQCVAICEQHPACAGKAGVALDGVPRGGER